MTTDALIIRENNNIGEADRFVTALTRDFGVVRASARGARNMKSSNASATQLLCYSRLTLKHGREKYIIVDAQPIQVFFELRSDIEKLTLAQYFCELAAVLSPQDEPAEDFLRLMLNALHFLGSGKYDARLVKSVLELRMLGLAGYTPDLMACSSCGCYECDTIWFMMTEGMLLCDACRHRMGRFGGHALSTNVLAAMRHVLYAEFDKCFSFTMSNDGLEQLKNSTEAYVLAQLNRGFKTLDFYHSIHV